MNFIELNGVYKNFLVRKRVVSVLRNVNLSIKEGEFVILLGPSGSGKSTLLNLIAGLDKPTFGEIIIGGEYISKLSNDELSCWRKENVGVIFQSYNLMSYMTALDNVALPMVFKREPKKKRIARANSLLKTVGLQNYEGVACQLLSGGEQQRVAIARSIVNDPKILIADEPTGDLDSRNAEEIVEILYTLYKEQKTTIIMATHDESYTKFADRVFRISNGRMSEKS